MTEGQFTLGLLSALLAFVGALGGTYLAARLEQASWKERFGLESKSAILDKRLAMLERAALGINKIGRLKALLVSLSTEAEMARLAGSSGERVPPADVAHELLKEVDEIKCEFSATAQLSVVLFGDQTRDALRELFKHDGRWWEADDSVKRKLLQSMYGELNEFTS